MNDDAALLRRYVDEGSEAAFTALVHRHVDLVYGVALRRTGCDSHRAREVAQDVFTAVARQARKLSHHPALGAWLHTATRNAALNLMIADQRRRTREHTAHALALESDAGNAILDWDRVRPVLDAAIDELPEADRTAVVLRFLERSSFSRIGTALRMTEDAARMRTDRALEKLRSALARRGITSTAAALGTLVASQSSLSAPLGFTAIVASHALAAGAGATGFTLFTTFTALMNVKLITTAAVTALIFFGIGAYVGFDATAQLPLPPLAALPEHPQKIAALREQNLRLQAQLDQLATKQGSVDAPRVAPPSPSLAPVPQPISDHVLTPERLRATLNNLRQISAAAEFFEQNKGRPASSLDELVGETKYIRRIEPVNGESYANLSFAKGMPLTVYSANGEPVTYDPVGQSTTKLPALSPAEQISRLSSSLGPKVGPSFQSALLAFQAAHGGNLPKSPDALLFYFPSPAEAADFVEMLQAKEKPDGKKPPH